MCPDQSLTQSLVEPLWDARQLALRLGVHRNRLYLLVRTGRIPHLRIGRAVRFDPDAIRAWERAGGWVTPNLTRQEPRLRGSK